MTASHDVQNLVEVFERLRPLQLRDERDVRPVGVRHQLTRLLEVRRGLHEADRDHVDAERQPEPQVVGILRRDRGRRQLDARRIDALVLADFAAFDHRRLNFPAVGRVDPQLDQPVGQQQPIARLDALREPGERRRNAARAAHEVAGGDRQTVAGLQGDRPASFERAGANLRPAEILENRHLPIRAPRRRAHPRERRAVRLVRAVREIQAEDVGAGGDERIEDGVAVARRADGRDDLCVSHRQRSPQRSQSTQR